MASRYEASDEGISEYGEEYEVEESVILSSNLDTPPSILSQEEISCHCDMYELTQRSHKVIVNQSQ